MMKKIVLIGLIALLTSCAKESDSPHNRELGALEVRFSLSGIATRAVDGSIYDQTGKGYTLPFSAIDVLTVELYESITETPIFTHKATSTEIQTIKTAPTGGTATLRITDIPLSTKYVKVRINPFADPDPDINHTQVTNYDAAPAPTMNRDQIPYQGISSEFTLSTDLTSNRVTVITTVEVAPVLSRFEIKFGAIKVVDPAADGYTFDWTAADAGKAKIKGYTAAEITAAENSAHENFKKKYGTNPSASAVYSYRVRLVRQTITSGINDWGTNLPTFYTNYFKQHLSSPDLVKNTNNGVDSWYTLNDGGRAEYMLNGAHSNLYTVLSAALPSGQVIAYHLFPQSVAPDATVQQVKDGMPHIILNVKDANTNASRWITIRAFRNTTDNKLITAFKPGYCYSLAMTDIVLTPWSLALEVRITDNSQTTDSDPVIKDFDQTANVPEPDGTELLLGLTVRPWRQKDIVVEL